MLSTFYVPIGGTWDWDGHPGTRWYEKDSDFCLFLKEHSFEHLYPNHSFEWSAELEGIPLASKVNHSSWIAGAKALIYYLDLSKTPLENRNIICHSHGLNVVLYACGLYKLQLNNLISVSSPIRNDMREVADIAIDNIEHYLHIRDSRKDWMGTLGQLFDGRFSFDRTNKWADDEDIVKGISHSKILRDKTCFHLWEDRRWLNFLAYGSKSTPK